MMSATSNSTRVGVPAGTQMTGTSWPMAGKESRWSSQYILRPEWRVVGSTARVYSNCWHLLKRFPAR
eukprot:5509515-Lingulodinium_polyedra.AAC.1